MSVHPARPLRVVTQVVAEVGANDDAATDAATDAVLRAVVGGSSVSPQHATRVVTHVAAEVNVNDDGAIAEDTTTDAASAESAASAASAALPHDLERSVWPAGGLGRDPNATADAMADAMLDASGTTGAATYAKTCTVVKGLVPQYCTEMADLYAALGVKLTDLERTLVLHAFLNFKSWKDSLPGYKVLLIIGGARQYGLSSRKLLRANITACVACHGGKVIIATDGIETADGGEPGANELVSEIVHELKHGDFPGVKCCVFTPMWNIATGILAGSTKDMKVDVAIALLADKVFITNKEGGAEIRQCAMTAICAGVGADVGCFEGGWGTMSEYESAFKRRKCGGRCNNLFAVNSGFMLRNVNR